MKARQDNAYTLLIVCLYRQAGPSYLSMLRNLVLEGLRNRSWRILGLASNVVFDVVAVTVQHSPPLEEGVERLDR
jgi:hypothetical protein